MTSESAVTSLIAQLYEAVGDPSEWPGLLENLATAIGGNGTHLIRVNMRSGGTEAVASVREDSAYVKSYNDYYAEKDCWAISFPRYFQRPSVLVGQMLCPDDELERSEFYADFLRPMDAFYLIGANTGKDGDEVSIVSSIRPKRAGLFGRDEISLLEILLPHLERALQLRRRLAALETQSQMLAGVLDRLPLGLILLSSSGKILLTNQAAEAILTQRDGLSSARGILETARSQETIELRRLIWGACATAAGRGFASGGAMSVSRPSLKRPFSVLVAPLRSAPFQTPGERPAAAVFVSDPETATEPNEAVLSRFFDLTRAEARVAAVLMQGKSIEETATELDISLNTARSHLKNIFGKTGTGRQGELIRLLVASPARIRLP